MILISEVMHPAGLKLLNAYEVHYDPDLYANRSALLHWAANADALIVRNQTQVDSALLSQAPRLAAVGRLGVGLDNLDMALLVQRKIPVIVPYGANAPAVAEYVVGSMIAFRRHVLCLVDQVRNGLWMRDMSGTEVGGKTLGIVGYGATGKAVAQRAHALGMDVSVYDPGADVPDTWRSPSLSALFSRSATVSLHTPLTAKTRHMVNRNTLDELPEGALVINTARGELIDEQALALALASGRLGGAILDVREDEPPPAHDVLRAIKNVWLTPHIAGLTQDSQIAIAQRVAARIDEILRSEAGLL